MIAGNIALAGALLGMAGCSSLVLSRGSRDVDTVATVFTKTAAYVYSQDFIGYDEPLSDAFSQSDLRVLRNQRSSLEAMVESALGLGNSVWGAKFAGEFGITTLLPLLRTHFMVPERCYGWEGPDYSQLESYLTDDQFCYSVAYLNAIEAITGESVDKVIHLTPPEAEQLAKYTGNPNSEFFHWSLWIQRKLKITNSAIPPRTDPIGPS